MPRFRVRRSRFGIAASAGLSAVIIASVCLLVVHLQLSSQTDDLERRSVLYALTLAQELPSVTFVKTLETPQEWCQVLTFSPAGRLFESNWLEATAWQTNDWSIALQLDRSAIDLRLLSLAPDGTHLLVADGDGIAEILDATSLSHEISLSRIDGSNRPRAAFSPDGHLLALKNREREIDVWDLESGTIRYTLRGHGSEVLSVAFSRDGEWLATGAGRLEGTISDSLIKVWNAETGELITTLATLAIGSNLSMDFTPDGSKLITAGTYGVILYDTATWTQIERLAGHRTWSHDCAISPDGHLLATVNDFSELCLWSTQTWELLVVQPLPASAVRVAFSADGSLLACAVAEVGEILVFSTVE
jgi:WD40 repeat protein